MSQKRYSNVVGFDDAPFTHDYVGDVQIVGAVFTGLKLTGVLVGEVEKDGADSAEKLTKLIAGSRFAEHVQLVMLQGVALAGFNVVDAHYIYEQLGFPVLIVSRRVPDQESIQKALSTKVRGGEEKRALIKKLGRLEPAGSVYVQRVGLTLKQATAVVERFAINSHIPEPLRTAHLIAGALVRGQSRGRP